MFLSKEDSTQLWDSVRQHDFSLFSPINQKLLNPQGATLRHLPVRLYLPHAAESGALQAEENVKSSKPDKGEKENVAGSVRVVQSLITPSQSSRTS